MVTECPAAPCYDVLTEAQKGKGVALRGLRVCGFGVSGVGFPSLGAYCIARPASCPNREYDSLEFRAGVCLVCTAP